MKTLLVIALLLAPAQAIASCESGVSVRSAGLAFCSDDVQPSGMGEAAMASHRRALAHAIATAQACFDSARSSPPGPGAARLLLTHQGELRPADFRDKPSRRLARKCARADWDSSCVVWACELGRFRKESLARACAARVRPYFVPGCDQPGDLRNTDARLLYSSCVGTWTPASYLVAVGRGSSWAARAGLFFTRADAERMGATWSRVTDRPVQIVRQRVDGDLIEQILKGPDDPI
jgi:hypothetical protein